jgi:hypothetical protein
MTTALSTTDQRAQPTVPAPHRSETTKQETLPSGRPALFSKYPPQLTQVLGRLDDLLARKPKRPAPTRAVRLSVILNAEQRKQAAYDYVSGMTIKELTTKYEIGRNVVFRVQRSRTAERTQVDR